MLKIINILLLKQRSLLALVASFYFLSSPLVAQTTTEIALPPTSKQVFSNDITTAITTNTDRKTIEQLATLRQEQLELQGYKIGLQQRSFSKEPGVIDSWAHAAVVSVGNIVQLSGALVATAIDEDGTAAIQQAFDEVGGFVASIPIQVHELNTLLAKADRHGRAILIGHAVIYTITPLLVGNVATRAVRSRTSRISVTVKRGGQIDAVTFLDENGLRGGQRAIVEFDPLAAELDYILRNPTEFPSPRSGMARRASGGEPSSWRTAHLSGEWTRRPAPHRDPRAGGTATLEAPTAMQPYNPTITATTTPSLTTGPQASLQTAITVQPTLLPAPQPLQPLIIVPPVMANVESSEFEISRREYEDLRANLGAEFAERYINVESWRAAGMPRPESIYNRRSASYSPIVDTWTLRGWMATYPRDSFTILLLLANLVEESHGRLQAKIINLQQLDDNFKQESYRVRIWENGEEILQFDIGRGFADHSVIPYLSNLFLLRGELAIPVLQKILPQGLQPEVTTMVINLVTHGNFIADMTYQELQGAYAITLLPAAASNLPPAPMQFFGYGKLDQDKFYNGNQLRQALLPALRITLKMDGSEPTVIISKENFPNYTVNGQTYFGGWRSSSVSIGLDIATPTDTVLFFPDELLLGSYSDIERQAIRWIARSFTAPETNVVRVEVRAYLREVDDYGTLPFNEPWPPFNTLR